MTPVCSCEDIKKLTLPNTVIKSAVQNTDGNTCRITAVVNHPPSKDRVTVSIALPVKNWNGKFLWYGLTRGTNLIDLSGTRGDPLTGDPFGIALEWVRYFLVLDPEWDIKSLTWAEFELLFNQSVDQYTYVIGTDNTDLTAFRDSGAKLIIIHGLADQLVPPQGTVEYFRKMEAVMEGAEATSKFARLFLVPGVDHGLMGAGPTPTGQIDALVRWVEKGKAPEYIRAEKKDESGNIIRTRNLLPYSTLNH